MILFSIFIWHQEKESQLLRFFFLSNTNTTDILIPKGGALYGIFHIRGIFSKHLAAKELLESRKSREHFKLSKEQ